MAVPSQPLIAKLSSPASIPLLTNLSREVQRAPLAITKPPATPKNYYCQELSITQKQALNENCRIPQTIKVRLKNSLPSVLWPIKRAVLMLSLFGVPRFLTFLVRSIPICCFLGSPSVGHFQSCRRRYQDYYHHQHPRLLVFLFLPNRKFQTTKLGALRVY